MGRGWPARTRSAAGPVVATTTTTEAAIRGHDSRARTAHRRLGTPDRRAKDVGRHIQAGYDLGRGTRKAGRGKSSAWSVQPGRSGISGSTAAGSHVRLPERGGPEDRETPGTGQCVRVP